jgi:hypothetical protein
MVQPIKRSPRSLVAFSYPTEPRGSVRAMASNASALIAMRTMVRPDAAESPRRSPVPRQTGIAPTSP